MINNKVRRETELKPRYEKTGLEFPIPLDWSHHRSLIWKSLSKHLGGLCGFFFFLIDLFLFFYFTILYWFCHTSTWVCHGYTRVPHPEPPSLLPPRTIPLSHPSTPAPSIQYHASNLDWCFVAFLYVWYLSFWIMAPLSCLREGLESWDYLWLWLYF